MRAPSTNIGWKDVDDALGRLEPVLRARCGKKMTAVCLKNLVQMKEHGADAAAVLRAIHQSFDAYARIPESGTPFPLGIAKAIGDAGCVNLTQLNWRMRASEPFLALAMRDDEARAIATHADALLPAYGDDDAEFAARVAWKNAHHFRLHLVVGRAFNRNDPSPTALLHEAWQRQQPPPASVPVGVVAGEARGVVYALGDDGAEPSAHLLERFRARTFVFSPDDGDNIELSAPHGLQRFFARVPLRITPHTLAWIVHLVRCAYGPVLVDVDDGLTVEWEPHEEEPRAHAQAASALLGITPPAPKERASIEIRVRQGSGSAGGDVVRMRYAPGELSVLNESAVP